MKSKFAVAALLCAGSAWAHHSFASFDRTKIGTVTGTISAMQWENPHVWFWVNTPAPNGTVATWAFEGAAPAEMARNGFRRDRLHVGDKVTVTFSRLRDGRNGGSFSRIVKADGTVLGAGGPPNGAPPAGAPPQ